MPSKLEKNKKAENNMLLLVLRSHETINIIAITKNTTGATYIPQPAIKFKMFFIKLPKDPALLKKLKILSIEKTVKTIAQMLFETSGCSLFSLSSLFGFEENFFLFFAILFALRAHKTANEADLADKC